MSLQTLVGVATPNWGLGESLCKIDSALLNCESVAGLYCIQRHSGPSYVQLRRESLLSATENDFIRELELANAIPEIDKCVEGFEARWQVCRYRREECKSEVQLWNHYLSLLFQPMTRRSWVLTGIENTLFIDAGPQRYFLPKRMEDSVASEAARLNLELLVEELATIASIPIAGLIGIPVHLLNPENASFLSSAWLYFDGERHSTIGGLGLNHTQAGPLYYSLDGPLGNVADLQLQGMI